jgi:hypothetical protein
VFRNFVSIRETNHAGINFTKPFAFRKLNDGTKPIAKERRSFVSIRETNHAGINFTKPFAFRKLNDGTKPLSRRPPYSTITRSPKLRRLGAEAIFADKLVDPIIGGLLDLELDAPGSQHNRAGQSGEGAH